MNISESAFDFTTYRIDFSPSDFGWTPSDKKVYRFKSNNMCLYVSDETAIAMRDKLNELFPTKPVEPVKSEQVRPKLPKEPEEVGYYITQQKRLLNKEYGGTWQAPGAGRFWKDGGKYTRDWGIVFATLGPEAFPLIPLNTDSEGVE